MFSRTRSTQARSASESENIKPVAKKEDKQIRTANAQRTNKKVEPKEKEQVQDEISKTIQDNLSIQDEKEEGEEVNEFTIPLLENEEEGQSFTADRFKVIDIDAGDETNILLVHNYILDICDYLFSLEVRKLSVQFVLIICHLISQLASSD